MLLLIDNYDSFAHNLARYFQRLGAPVQVVRNDAVSVAEVRELRPAAIVLSPGPCTPAEAGCSLDLVHAFHKTLPIFGVCLGHQTIAAVFGGNIVRAHEPMHGRTTSITHQGTGLFAGLPTPLTVARYHSLVADPATLPVELLVTATAPDGTIMALQHREWPTFGVQFHPESILTEHGYAILANFLRCIGHEVPQAPTWADELMLPVPTRPTIPSTPVTF